LSSPRCSAPSTSTTRTHKYRPGAAAIAAFIDYSAKSSFTAMAFVPAAFRPALPSRAPPARPAVCRAPLRTAVIASAGGDVPDVLKKILARKVDEVAALKAKVAATGPDHLIAKALANKGVERSCAFARALTLPKGTLTVIAEIKRRSPSKGLIGCIKDPGALSRTYHAGGAAAISVLTDDEGFGGSMADLAAVVAQQKKFRGEFPGPCPVLRKDFIVDEVQIAEAAVAGAGAVLLIMAALGRERCGELQEAAWGMGLDALVEVHDEAEVEDAVAIGAKIVGVNNRDLRTFEVDLQTSVRMAKVIPDGIIKVAESGIEECTDAWMLRDAGYSAVLVGESLVRAFEGSAADSTSYSVGYNQAMGLIKAFKAKGSVKYGPTSSAAFWGKGEGAKETLVRLAANPFAPPAPMAQVCCSIGPY
jgi:indole-3-glycerol phosphate synthase